MKTIVLCGGGTAGHVLPNLALLPYLKDFKVVYIGMKGGIEEELSKKHNVEFYPIDVVKFSRTNLLENVKIPFLLPKCVKRCEELLKKIKPNVVLSKGGYASLPVTFACKKLAIPYAIHESDYTMGLANKLAKRHARIVMTNFPNTFNGKNALCVGIPLRQELFSNKSSHNILKALSLPPRRTILVMGGSLGATSLNKFVLSILDELTKQYNVVHLTGKGKDVTIDNPYYLSIPYADNMGELYKCSDVVISRAGATSIAEIKTLNKKAILLPLSKKASRGDQIKNANAVKCATIRVFYEENLDKTAFLSAISELMRTKVSDTKNRGVSSKSIVDVLHKISL